MREMSSDYIDVDLKIRCGKDQGDQVDSTPTIVSDWLKALMVGID